MLSLPAMDTEPWFSSTVAAAAARHAVAGVWPSPCAHSTSRPSPARLSLPLPKSPAPPALFLSLLSFSTSSRVNKRAEQSHGWLPSLRPDSAPPRPPNPNPCAQASPTASSTFPATYQSSFLVESTEISCPTAGRHWCTIELRPLTSIRASGPSPPKSTPKMSSW